MAYGRADVARDAILLVGEDAEAGEAGVDVHERGERAGEAAPNPAAEPEIPADADDAGQKNIDDVIVVELHAEEVPTGEESMIEIRHLLPEPRVRQAPAQDAK